MKRILIFMLSILIIISTFSACSDAKETTTTPSPEATSDSSVTDESLSGDKKFAMVFGLAGLGDNGYNDETYLGCELAVENFGWTYDYVEPNSVNDYETQFRMFADSEEYALIIGNSADQADALKLVAPDYPDQKFSILDTIVEGYGNISSVTAINPEQTFLSGMLAGLVTQDDRFPLANEENIIGFAIAMDSPLSRSQAAGFIAGAKYVNPEVEVITNFIGSYKDPGKAKEIALSAYGRGADVVSHNAGASGIGVFQAATESNRYVVGTSLSSVDPVHSLSTSMKKVDLFVNGEVQSVDEGTWKAGVKKVGIADGMCDYNIEGLDTVFPDDVIEKVETAKQYIIDGKLTIPETIENIDAWAAENQFE